MATKIYKAISRQNKFQNPDARFIHKRKKPMAITALVSEEIYDDKLQRVVKSTKSVVVDNVASLSKYKVSDFYLENLQAIDADMSMSHLSSSTLSKVDKIENGLQRISNNLNS